MGTDRQHTLTLLLTILKSRSGRDPDWGNKRRGMKSHLARHRSQGWTRQRLWDGHLGNLGAFWDIARREQELEQVLEGLEQRR